MNYGFDLSMALWLAATFGWAFLCRFLFQGLKSIPFALVGPILLAPLVLRWSIDFDPVPYTDPNGEIMSDADKNGLALFTGVLSFPFAVAFMLLGLGIGHWIHTSHSVRQRRRSETP